MIEFLTCFIILVIISGLFCNGWYIITRGNERELPDGRIVKEGMIFGFWQRFWERKTGTEQIIYDDIHTEMALEHLSYMDAELAKALHFEGDYTLLEEDKNLWGKINKIEKLLSCKIRVIDSLKFNSNHFLRIKFYTEDPTYMFPNWLIKPISKCVICFASIYGSIIYWGFVGMQNGLFEWCENKFACYFFFYFIFMVSNAFINDFLHKKNK